MAKEIPAFKAQSIHVSTAGKVETDAEGNMVLDDQVLGRKTLTELYRGPTPPPASSFKAPSMSDPPSAVEGDVYYNLISNQLRQFDGLTWKDVDTGGNLLPPQVADPADGEAGNLYFNTVRGRLRVHDGTAWADVGGGPQREEETFDVTSADEALGYVTLSSALVGPDATYDVFLNGLRVLQRDVRVEAPTRRLALLNGEVIEEGDFLSVVVYATP